MAETAFDAAGLAATLVAARRSGDRLPAAPAGGPATMAEAYAVQDALISAMAEPVVGWKVGLTNAEAQAKVGADEPMAGPLFASAVTPSPATLSTPPAALRIVECEFGFRMGADLPPRDAPYGDEEVAAAIATLHPAVEVVDIHVPGGLQAGPRWAVADSGGNLFWVHGAGTADWTLEDLPTRPVSVSRNGIAEGDGTAAAALGNPVTVVTWLANHLIGRGRRLEAGHWVSTGLCTPLFSAEQGDRITADYGALGPVEVTF